MINAIHVYYSGYDFFGNYDSMLECRRSLPTKKEVQKAWTHFKKDRYCAIHLELSGKGTIVFVWDSCSEFDTDIVTVRVSPEWNVTEDFRMSSANARKWLMEFYGERDYCYDLVTA